MSILLACTYINLLQFQPTHASILQIYESAIFQAQISNSASYNSHQSWQQVDKELILCFDEFQRMGECWLTYWTSNGWRKETSPHEVEANTR